MICEQSALSRISEFGGDHGVFLATLEYDRTGVPYGTSTRTAWATAAPPGTRPISAVVAGDRERANLRAAILIGQIVEYPGGKTA